MSSNPFGGSFNAIDSIFNPGRAHQIEEETRQMILPITVDSPDQGNREKVSIDLDAGVAVVRPASLRPAQEPDQELDDEDAL